MMINVSKPAALATALLLSAFPVFAQDQPNAQKSGDKKFSAGLTFSETASADDAGLPLYPGATPHRDKKHDADGVNLGFWGGSFGLKVVVVKLETPDSPDKVAAFYQQALSQYGPVLDCRKPAATAEAKINGGTPKPLSCDRDKPEKNGLLFKAGTREKQRIASIQPRGQGSVFQLVYIEKRGVD